MPQYCGGFREVMYALEQNATQLDLDKLISYADRLDIAVARRIGWALEQTGVERDKLIKLIQKESPGYRLLDPTSPAKGKYSKEWRLQLNF